MDEIRVFSYVEDEPSKHVLIKLVERHNQTGGRMVLFHPGFPSVTGGFGQIKKKCDAFLRMADADRHTLLLTDLDNAECPATLIKDWFFVGGDNTAVLPPQVIFRVAVREVEAWLMADKDDFAKFLGISSSNFADAPETLPDPKQFFLNVLRRKATRKKIRDMLPTGKAHIGVAYNEKLCEFINNFWSIDRACAKAPSLQKALSALGRL